MKSNILNDIELTTKLVENKINQLLAPYNNHSTDLYNKLKYSVYDIGIRIRPYLFKIIYEFGGKSFNNAIDIAAAIELIQISTLVTDDILDSSDIRNGRQSIYNKWGTNYAILVGLILKSISIKSVFNGELDNKRILQVIKETENVYDLINTGQYLDLANEKLNSISECDYIKMIKLTTSKFIQLPIKIALLLTEIPKNIGKKFDNYGINLGYAYQIRDDVIDIIGDKKFIGKPVAGDIIQKKKRLPLIHAISHSFDPNKQRILNILGKDTLNDNDVKEIIEIIISAGSIEYSINKVKEYCDIAVNSIVGIKNCKEKTALINLTEIVRNIDF